MFELNAQVANPTARVAVETLTEGMVVREDRMDRDWRKPAHSMAIEVMQVSLVDRRVVHYLLDTGEVRTLARGEMVEVL